jgi:hypothetical protein
MPKIIEEEREDDVSPGRTPKGSEAASSEKKSNRYKHVFHHKSISSGKPIDLKNNVPRPI